MTNKDEKSNQSNPPTYDPSRLVIPQGRQRNLSNNSTGAPTRLASFHSRPSPATSNTTPNTSTTSNTTIRGRFPPNVNPQNPTRRRFTPNLEPRATIKREPRNTDSILDIPNLTAPQSSYSSDKLKNRNAHLQRQKKSQRERKGRPAFPTVDTSHLLGSHTTSRTTKHSPETVDSSSDEDKMEIERREQNNRKQLFETYFTDVPNPPIQLSLDDEEHERTHTSARIKTEPIDILEDSLLDQRPSESKQQAKFEENLFNYDMNDVLREDELFFIQLPSHLPMEGSRSAQGSSRSFRENVKKSQPQQSFDDEYESIWTREFENSLTNIHEGQIGVLKVYRSGKTQLELKTKDSHTPIVLDVMPSQDHSFAEDIAAIDPEAKTCYMLGSVTKRIQCMPDCDSLISKDGK